MTTPSPIDRPFTSTHSSASSPVSPQFSRIGSTNDGARRGTAPQRPKPKQRRRQHDVTLIARSLSDRDLAILQSVAEHRFLTLAQIEALHFMGNTASNRARAARRVCARLRELRVLGGLPRRVGGTRAGADGLVHYVDVVGDQLLRGSTGRTVRRPRLDPSARFVDHTLAIASAHVALIEADRERRVELLRCEVEPSSWRTYLSASGTRFTLKPDLYAETAPEPGSEYIDSWFIEIDRGNESVRPTLLAKCHEYEAYWRSGTEQDQNNGAFPLVVWSMSHPDPHKAQARRDALRRAIDGDRALTHIRFHIIAPEQLIELTRKGGDL
ncbi:replication-relaxation family protein [Nocardia sp. NPDC003482]